MADFGGGVFNFAIRQSLMQAITSRHSKFVSGFMGFIQAGGRSSRMGEDKAWLETDGCPMIERVLTAMTPVVDRPAIVVSASNPQIERYEKLAGVWKADLIYDLHDHRGPLGGIHTSLKHSESARDTADRSVLILACDLPFVTTRFLQFLREVHETQQFQSITVPLDEANRHQPLVAIYDRSCQSSIEQMLTADEFKVDLLFERVPVRRVNFFEFAHLEDAEHLFININTPEEYRASFSKHLP
jgi:molybdenum cofactor guanylyltransferase